MEPKTKDEVRDLPGDGCIGNLIGIALGMLISLCSVPFFRWWALEVWDYNTIPDNQTGVYGVIFIEFLFFALCIIVGGTVGWEKRWGRHLRMVGKS